MITKFSVSFNSKDYPCFFVNSEDQALEVIDNLISKEGILAADLETAALPKWKHVPQAALSPFLARPRLLQLFTGTGIVIMDLFKVGPLDLAPLFHKRPAVFHNMTFDYKMLCQHHNVTEPDMHCTCIMARCVLHATFAEDKAADLGSAVQTFLGQVINKKAGASDWGGLLTFEQIRYAASDVIVLMELYKKLDEYIDQLKLRKVYDLYRKAQLVLSQMELNGICIDKTLHRKNVIKWREDLKDASDSVLELTGLERITDSTIAAWLEKSLPPETKEIWPKTEKDERLSTDANTFADFSHLDIVKPFSKYQKLKKLTTAFGMNLLGQINPATEKLHPSYRVAGARTGRLSCAEPNIQQAPRSKEFRSIFIPSPGYVFVVADYSQVEVRCIAELSNDPEMLKAFEEGLDIYSHTAAQLTNIPYEVIEKRDEEGNKHPARQQAKALVLGLNYGLGARKFAHYAKKGYGVEITETDAVGLVAAYRELYSKLRDWQIEQVNKTALKRYTAFSAMGKSRKMTEENYYGACMNHPIQGSCAEIMLLALVYASEELKDTSARLLASVHDEILVECKPEDVEAVKQKLADSMRQAYLEIIPSGRTLKNLIAPSHGANWADAKAVMKQLQEFGDVICRN